MSMLGQNHIFSGPTLTDLSTPGSIFGSQGQPNIDYVQPQQQAGYLWGANGAKLTPEQLALQQKQAAARSQSDFSPVANVWAGLGRVADNVMGALDTKSLDKEAVAQAGSRDLKVAALLAAGADDPALAAGISDPDSVVSQLAKSQFERLHPKAQQPGTLEQNYNFIASKDPALADSYLKAEGSPQVLGTNPETGALQFYPKGGMPNMGAQSQGIPTPKSQAEYDAIPKGATFVDDDGQTKVKS